MIKTGPYHCIGLFLELEAEHIENALEICQQLMDSDPTVRIPNIYSELAF